MKRVLSDPPRAASTLHGFRAWAHAADPGVTVRASYVQGFTILDSGHEDLNAHNNCRLAVYTGLERVLEETDAGDLLVRGAFFVNDLAGLATHPDAIFCFWSSLREGRVHFREFVSGSGEFVELAGSPDLVVEIVSDESQERDTQMLPEAYFRAQVAEYWLIDARGCDVDFRIHSRRQCAFESCPNDADGFARSDVLDRSFRMTRRRNPADGWRYTLEFR